MNQHMKSNLKLIFSLLAVVIGFGSQWNCTIQIGEKPPGGSTETTTPSGSGCVNQMPTYTLGEPPNKDEYSIIVKEFKVKKEVDYPQFKSAAIAISADLRAKRVHNSVWDRKDKIYVTVGRYFTENQALAKLPAIQMRGYPDAYVGKPNTDPIEKEDCCPPPTTIDWAGVFAMMIIVVLVILAAASQTKK